MKLLKVSLQSIKGAVRLLERGGIIVYPTDTAYALGADSKNKKAIEKIYKIKGRKKIKKLPLIAASLAMVRQLFILSENELSLAKKYWPEALSLILKIKNPKSKLRIYLDTESIAVRVPKIRIAREISKRLGRPIISTSANISGTQEFYDARKIFKQFKNRKYKPNLILDAGKLRKIKPSTIVKIKDEKIVILRQGKITISN